MPTAAISFYVPASSMIARRAEPVRVPNSRVFTPTESSTKEKCGGRRASPELSSKAGFELEGEKIIPIIRGSAYITAEIDLILDPHDPLRFGSTNEL